MACHCKSPPPPSLMTSMPFRAPSWVSTRRLFEEKLHDLHKCTNISHVKQLHAQIIKHNLHADKYVGQKLVSALSLCRQMALAVRVFHQVPDPDVVFYNTLIRAHVQNSQPLQAFEVFSQMQINGVFADNFTYPYLLKACFGLSWLPVVQMMHGHVVKLGFLEDIFVPNALIDCYSKCGASGVKLALKLFSVLEEKDIVTWNSMLGGLAKAGQLLDAHQLFEEMPHRDMIGWNTMLDGYVKAGDMVGAFRMFERMPERDTVSWSIMVMGFSKAGDMDMARVLFDKMPFKSLVTWTIIIAGYAEKGLVKEANRLYNQMVAIGFQLDAAAAVSVLAACAESGLLELGIKIHSAIKRSRLKSDDFVLNALIDMYAKCGNIDIAVDVFNTMPRKDLVSWNAIIQGLGLHGHGKKALELFSKMRTEGFHPDKFTFVGVLLACNHSGQVDEGIMLFKLMESEFGVVPQIEHYGCLVDLLGRGGRLVEAIRVIQKMPMEPNAVIIGSLLAACKMNNAVGLAKEVADNLLRLNPKDPGNYSILSNIYAAAEDWDRVSNVRSKIKNICLEKPSGVSCIVLGDEVHIFTVSDKSHPESDQIYQMLDRLVEDLQTIEYAQSVVQTEKER